MPWGEAFDMNHDGKLDWMEQDELDQFLSPDNGSDFSSEESDDSLVGLKIWGFILLIVAVIFIISDIWPAR